MWGKYISPMDPMGLIFEEEILISKYLTNQEVRPYAKFVRC